MLQRTVRKVVDDDDAVELVGYLIRSKAIWKSPELLNLVVPQSDPSQALSPSKAFSVVLQHTGSRKKALAARWYACAVRDYGEESLGNLVAILQSPRGAERLEKLLTPPEYRAPETGSKE